MGDNGDSTVFHDVVTHLDCQATALAVSASGSHVVLAGRKHLSVVDLEFPGDVAKTRKIQRQMRYDATAVEWNPHKSMEHYIISTVGTVRVHSKLKLKIINI
jgi:hypothetical protein